MAENTRLFFVQFYHFSNSTDHLLGTCHHFGRSRTYKEPHHQNEKGKADQTKRDDQRKRDTAAKGVGIKEQQRTKGKGDNPAYTQDTESGDEDLGNHKGDT